MILNRFLIKTGVQKAIPFLILLCIAILGYWQVALFRDALKWDLIDTAYPWKYFIGDCLQSNILPLWNPYQHCGYPIHADPQSSAWYPITWVFGYFWGYSVYIMSIDFVLHIFLAGSGMYLLGRRLGFMKSISLMMGTAYMFSGFFVGNAQHFMWIISGTWLPFILVAYINLYQYKRIKQAVIFGLLICLTVTGGYPAFTMILIYLLLVLFIFYAIRVFQDEGKSSLLQFFKINLLALFFSITNSAVYLFSILKLIPELTRTAGFSLQEALFGPLSLPCLISFIFPFGVVNHDLSLFRTDLSMTNIYFGLPIFIFFIASFFIKKPPLIKLFLFWGLFLLSAAVGDALPIRAFLYNYVPFFNIFRFPALLRLFVILSFIIVAGFAINEFADSEKKLLVKVKTASFITFVILILIGGIFINGKYINLGEYLKSGNLFSFSKTSSIAQQIFFQGLIQLILIGLFYWIITQIKSKKKQISLILIIVITDLIIATQLNAPYTVFEQGYYQKNISKKIDEMPKGFPLPEMNTVITTNDNTAPHFESLWRNLNIFYKQIAYDGNNATHLRNYIYLEDSLNNIFWATLNNPPIYFGGSFFSNEDLHVKDRTDVDSSMVFLSEKDLNEINPSRTKEGESICFVKFSPNRIQLQTKTEAESFVVLLQNNYYGWEAEIDNIETQIRNTNLSFMGVFVPAGEHQITFSFKPKFVILGFYVSLLSLFISFSILLYLNAINLKKSKNTEIEK